MHHRQAYLLSHVDWPRLIEDYFARNSNSDVDSDRRWMLLGTRIYMLHATQADVADSMLSMQNDELSAVQGRLESFGYLSQKPIEPRPYGQEDLGIKDLGEYISQWLQYTSDSGVYFMGNRRQAAFGGLPIEQLRWLRDLEYELKRISRDGRVPWPIESALRDSAERLMSEHDASLEAALFGDYPEITVHGTEGLAQYGISQEEFLQTIESIRHSFPADCMRTLRYIDIMPGESSEKDENGVVWRTEGEMSDKGRLITIWPENIAANLESRRRKRQRDFKDRFRQRLLEDMIHEVTHVAHLNLPLSWLRRLEKLNSQVSLSSISIYSETSSAKDQTNGRLEVLSEGLRYFSQDPMKVMAESYEHFLLFNELLELYDWRSLETAHTVIERQKNGTKITPHEYAAAAMALGRSREERIAKRLLNAKHSTPLGRLSVLAAKRHAPARRKVGVGGRV